MFADHTIPPRLRVAMSPAKAFFHPVATPSAVGRGQDGNQPAKLLRKEKSDMQTKVDTALQDFEGTLPGSGHQLPVDVRNFYEPCFGQDFSNVKIHSDVEAHKSA